MAIFACNVCGIPTDVEDDTVMVSMPEPIKSTEGPDGFAGAWAGRIISSDCSTLTWKNGEKSRIEVDGEKIRLESHGRVYAGLLQGGQRIRWSDGDIWERDAFPSVLEANWAAGEEGEDPQVESNTGFEEKAPESVDRSADDGMSKICSYKAVNEEEEEAEAAPKQNAATWLEEASKMAEEERRLDQEREEECRRCRRMAAQRKESIATFLKERNFKDAVAPKKSLMSTTYPIHAAAREGDERIVELLLEEGVDPAQKDSSGKTAVQIAQKLDKKGSHAKVLRALGGA